MEHLRDEDEQVAALKQWWKENGNALLIGVGLALAAIFGWKAYQQHTIDQREQASMLYDQLTQAVAAADTGSSLNTESSVIYLAQELKEKFPGTVYAQFASLFEAKELVAEEKFAEAEALLVSVQNDIEDPALKGVVTTRLARVKAAQEDYDGAIALLKASEDSPFYVAYQELKGDILKMKGERSEAKQAYQDALRQAEALSQPTQILETKINDLADV